VTGPAPAGPVARSKLADEAKNAKAVDKLSAASFMILFTQ
jgi:hypothetical protein